MNVLVTGGAGYIGSVVVEEAVGQGHSVFVLDNLEKGHAEMVHEDAVFVEHDLADKTGIVNMLRTNNIEAVVHMAAYSLVGESVKEPGKYYRNNVVNGLNLLDAMVECGVKKLVFSSTAAVYGEPEKQPIEEMDATAPTNPYGETKLAFEHALKWYDAAYGLHYASLRYFNAAGATARCGEMHDPETHLIPIVLQAVAGKRDAVEVFGDDYPTPDGTCVRDYIHVVDLARAHLLVLDELDKRSVTYNLGCGGDGYTVNQVIAAAEQVTGCRIEKRVGQRRSGDPAVLVASPELIKLELGWGPKYQDLDLIIETAWKWMRDQKDGGQGRSAIG